jgi:long-chain acyl-CoA synthetase
VNLAAALLHGGLGRPEAPALVGEHGTTTFGRLADAAARLATGLADDGVSPGDRVALVAGNDEAFVTGYLAVLHAGATCAPLNPGSPPAALEAELATIEPRLTLAAGSSAPVVTAASQAVRTIDLDALPATAAMLTERDGDDVAVLLFTSGTAGRPRAAQLTHANLAANIAEVQGHAGLAVAPADVTLGALPFFHIFGLNVVLGVALAAGATTVLVDRFDPERTVELVRRHGVTILAAVPTMFGDWLDLEPAAAPADAFGSVRLAVSGAAELPEPVAAGFTTRFGVVLHQGYGLTEASPIVTTTVLGPSPPPPGSIGRPVPGVEVRLVDADGADVLAGDPGEVWVRGPNVFAGYWRDDEATAQALTDDGWLRTGDIAVLDDDGDLRLVDRRKDLVIVSGFNVYPAEVEDVLRTHPDVADAAVIGEASPRTGETVVAFVQPKPGARPDPATLAAFCGRSLARYKCPTRVELIDELPRDDAGKLRRRALPT